MFRLCYLELVSSDLGRHGLSQQSCVSPSPLRALPWFQTALSDADQWGNHHARAERKVVPSGSLGDHREVLGRPRPPSPVESYQEMPENMVCFGWGSLIWRLDGLPVNGWRPDSPCVSVEFVRQSSDGRLTLVLYSKADPVPSLWAQMKVGSLDEAVEALAKREDRCGKPFSNPLRDIGRWPDDRAVDQYAAPKNILELPKWAEQRQVDYVNWTALGPRFNKTEGEFPATKEKAVEYLRRLPDHKLAKAKEYVRYAPQQIRTAYREHIRHCMQWKPTIADCLETARGRSSQLPM